MHDGRSIRMLTVIDEYTRECLAIDVERRLNSENVLGREIFYTLKEAKVLITNWRWEYNHFWPHSRLGYRPPAPGAIEPPPLRFAVGLS